MLALNSVLNFLQQDEGVSALWLDVEGDFTGERAYAMTRGIAERHNAGLTDAQVEAVLDRMSVSRCTSVGGVVESLDRCIAAVGTVIILLIRS